MSYATLAELKTALRITDSTHDTPLQTALDAATAVIDGYCKRTFAKDASASARYFEPTPRGPLYFDDVAVLTNFAIAVDRNNDATYGEAWTADTHYRLAPLNAVAAGQPFTHLTRLGGYSFPTSGLVKITAVWGWPAVPASVQQACLLQASRLYERQKSPLGVAGVADFGVLRVQSRVDPDVEVLLAPYRLVTIA